MVCDSVRATDQRPCTRIGCLTVDLGATKPRLRTAFASANVNVAQQILGCGMHPYARSRSSGASRRSRSPANPASTRENCCGTSYSDYYIGVGRDADSSRVSSSICFNSNVSRTWTPTCRRRMATFSANYRAPGENRPVVTKHTATGQGTLQRPDERLDDRTKKGVVLVVSLSLSTD
jgi:hypothetical protein